MHRTESSEENVLLTAREVAFAAECQLEAMRRPARKAEAPSRTRRVLFWRASG